MQADSGAGPAAAPAGSQGTSALTDMMGNIGPVAICVLVLLLIASLYSWTVILGKTSAFGKATRESKRFIRAFRKATQLKEIAALAADCPGSPLAQVFEDVYETYKRQTGGSGPPRNLVPLERTAQTAASEAVTSLERRMTWLATIASSSPFVGLFGTVMGVVDAFHGLGTAGAANAAGGCAGHLRGADYDGGGIVCGRAGGGGLQPVHGADQGFCLGDRRFLPRAAEFAGGDSGADGCARRRRRTPPEPRCRGRLNVAFTSSNGQTRSSLAEINITPLVDVVLVLLVIFMITAPVLQSGIEVAVPKTRTVKEITEQRMVVTIDRDQQVFLGDQPVNIHELARKLQQAGKRSGAPGDLSAGRRDGAVWGVCERDGRGEAGGDYEYFDCDAAAGDEERRRGSVSRDREPGLRVLDSPRD